MARTGASLNVPTMSQVEAAFCRSAPWRAFARRVVLPWALAGSAPRGSVLEIGGGSGALAFELLRRLPGIAVTVADVDPAMVASARRRLEPFGDRATVVRADATHLDLADESFDAVCSWIMLHHTIQWKETLTEATRVLRSGGLLVGYDLLDTGISRAIHRLDRSPHRLVRAPELAAHLSTLPLERVSVDRRLAGLVARFSATRRS